VSPPPHRSRSYLRGRCAAAVCVVLLAACGSEPSARPGGDTTTTTTATTIQTAESTTTTVASTRPSPTTSPLLAAPVTAALGGRPATFGRVDVPLALGAPVDIVAASPSSVVAIGFRSVGNYSQWVSAALSADGRQWRAVDTPWATEQSGTPPAQSFGVPRALAFGGGAFLAVGQRVEIAEDFKQTTFAIAARSRDGINWETIDLRPSLATASPAGLVHFGGKWLMTAEPVDGTPPRQTLMYSSTDGTTWERIATLDFRIQHLRATTFGLFAVGWRGENNSTRWLTAASVDGSTWKSSELGLGWTSPVQSVLVEGDRVRLIVSEDVTGFSKDRRARLLSSRDGFTWQAMPTPPCFGAGDYVGPAIAALGMWAIVVETETPKLAVSHDDGASWSCTALNGDAFETRWGPPYLTNIIDVQGKLALVGGRTIEPGAKPNWAAAIWFLS